MGREVDKFEEIIAYDNKFVDIQKDLNLKANCCDTFWNETSQLLPFVVLRIELLDVVIAAPAEKERVPRGSADGSSDPFHLNTHALNHRR